MKKLFLAIFLAVLLSGCGPKNTPTPVAPTPTAIALKATTTPIPTPITVSNPTGSDWMKIFQFSGGPSVYAKFDPRCFVDLNLASCSGLQLEIFVSGYQTSVVYFNGYEDITFKKALWSLKLQPGLNKVSLPKAGTVAIGNLPGITP